MIIRDFRPQDARHICAIFFASVREIGPRAYSAAQVEAWAPELWSEALVRCKAADGRVWLVATDPADRPVAFGDLERDGHVDHLYCHPSVLGMGIGSALYRALEAVGREWELARLFTEASELARPMFERQGFALIARRDFELRDVAIHNYAMEKRL